MSIYVKDPKHAAKGCMIWMHGLGSDAANMMGLADELLLLTPVRHIFLDAPVRPITVNNKMSMRAWYDITGLKLTDREDRDGILASEKLIRNTLDQQHADGFSSNKIFLAGFSQGAAMALFTGLRVPNPLAGIIALSGYLPLASEAQASQHQDTPVFIGSGDFDPVVLPAWTGMSVAHLRERGYHNVTWNRYPMEHAICGDEVRDLGRWISTTLDCKGAK